MKRTPLKRKTALKARTPIKKANPERQAKRRQSYTKKLAAYRRSETYQIVEKRASGRCEHVEGFHALMLMAGLETRCAARRAAGDRLTHHHKTYARFGGDELPEDIIVLCDEHDDEAESQHPTRKRDYRRSA